MTWTYASSDLSTALAQIRFTVGDTDSSDKQVTDEEIAYCQTRAGSNNKLAAAYVCDGIAAKYARLVTSSVGDLSTAYSDLQQHYKDLAAQLRLEGGSLIAIPIAGGISEARVTVVNEDTDRVKPAFFRGMMDNPDAERLEPGDVEEDED